MCVRRRRAGGGRAGAGAERRECTTKNSNPTQRCGEKEMSIIHGGMVEFQLPCLITESYGYMICGIQRNMSMNSEFFGRRIDE